LKIIFDKKHSEHLRFLKLQSVYGTNHLAYYGRGEVFFSKIQTETIHQIFMVKS